MLTNALSKQQEVTSFRKPVSEKVWFFGVLNILLVLVILFFAEASSVHADGLFDFQMKLAKKGNAEAQFKVGEMYETGFGVKKSQSDAEQWINKAASQGHETAGYKLLYWDMIKNGMKGGNKAKYDNLMKMAETGDGQAMYYVGKMYGRGVGVEKNYDKALDWLGKAAFIGILEAERESVAIREEKQKVLAEQSRREESRKAAAAAAAAALAAQAKQEQSTQEATQQAIKATENKQKNEAAAAASNSAAESKAQMEREKEKQVAAEEKEKKRQALLQRKVDKEEKTKEKFESDPCAGKSARFLSTCR